MVNKRMSAWVLGAAVAVACSNADAAGARRPNFSTAGLLVNSAGKAVYGFANLRATTWLGVQVIAGDFTDMRQIGFVAIVPTAQPGVYVWISNIGPTGTLTYDGVGVSWRDAAGNQGRYTPL